MTLGIISARGGSVRLPRKNIKSFCGEPLLIWSIAQAKASKLIDYVCVTTDDEEMFGAAYDFGCHQTILRPKWDNDTTLGVPLLHAINVLKKQGIIPDHIITLMPIMPLRFPGDIDGMIQEHLERGSDSTRFFGISRECSVYKNDRDMTNRYGKGYFVDPVVWDKSWQYSSNASGTCIGKTEYLRSRWDVPCKSDREFDKLFQNVANLPSKIGAYSVYDWQAFECDYLHWFEICEVIMEKMILKGRGIELYQDYKDGHI